MGRAVSVALRPPVSIDGGTIYTSSIKKDLLLLGVASCVNVSRLKRANSHPRGKTIINRATSNERGRNVRTCVRACVRARVRARLSHVRCVILVETGTTREEMHARGECTCARAREMERTRKGQKERAKERESAVTAMRIASEAREK